MRIQYQNLQGISENVEHLVAGLSSSNGVVDLQPYFFRFTLATTIALIFGQPAKSHEDETQAVFARSFDYASAIAALRLRLADLYWTYTPSSYTKSCEVVKNYADGFVKQALDEKKEDGAQEASQRYAFIHDLYDELKDPALVRDQLVNVLIAGRDTTACLMSWTL